MIRDGEVEPGLYRVTTHAGETLDMLVTGVDHRDQGDYLIYLPEVPANPDRAITVDGKLPVGDIRIITDDHGGVWRLSGGTKIDSIEAVPVSEVRSLRDAHAARSPVATPTAAPASEAAPPEPQIRPQTADSDSVGILTSADIGQRPNAPENDDSAHGDDGDEVAPKSSPKGRAPAATKKPSPQPEPERVAHADAQPAVSPRPEHLFEDQYQPGVQAPPSVGPSDAAVAAETLIVTEDAAP